jgi:hypothetical protein
MLLCACVLLLQQISTAFSQAPQRKTKLQAPPARHLL